MQIDIHHSIRYQPVLPCKPKWQRNGVDLEKFSKLVDEEMTYLQAESNLSKCLARFTNILNSVTDTHEGKTKSCWKADPWMTPLLWAKIQTRNQLRGTIKTNREEWIEECREANGAMNQVKKRVLKWSTWRGHVENWQERDMESYQRPQRYIRGKLYQWSYVS